MGFEHLHGRMILLEHRLGTFWPFAIGLFVLFAVFILGVVGYMVIEDWPFFESLYMVVITLSTVGFQEVNPLTEAGRLFTIGLILCGVGSFAYLVGSFTQILIEGRIQKILGRRRLQKSIEKLTGHTIICGYGRIGSIVAQELAYDGSPVVVVEKDEILARDLSEKFILHVNDDATKDETLLSAGIMRAKALVTALTQEAANVYVTLTARQLNPNLFIVARADAQQHIQRLKRAGANQVLIPHLYGGVRMAQSVLRPTVTNFLDLAQSGSNIDLSMEELLVKPTSNIAGKDLIASEIRPRFNLIIIAIKKHTGEMIFNPVPKTVLEPGDTMVIVGPKENLKRLQETL